MADRAPDWLSCLLTPLLPISECCIFYNQPQHSALSGRAFSRNIPGSAAGAITVSDSVESRR